MMPAPINAVSPLAASLDLMFLANAALFRSGSRYAARAFASA
jgi:hypothetical protein